MRFGGNRRFGGGRGGGRFGGDRRSFDRDDNQPKPIKVGEEYDVEIKEVGSKGDGIARVNNFVVFVNGSKMGEKVHIKITDVRDRFAIGEKTGESKSEPEGEKATVADEDTSEEETGDDESTDEESTDNEEE